MAPITNDPEEALKISLVQKEEAKGLRAYVSEISQAISNIQRENNYAPRLAMAYQRSN